MSETNRENSAGRRPHLAIPFFIWALSAIGLAYSSSAVAAFHPQLYLSVALLAVLLICKRLNPASRMPRVLFLGVATFIVLRYFFWRTLYTIEFSDWLSFTCALILYV